MFRTSCLCLQMVNDNNYSGESLVRDFGMQVRTNLTSIDARVLPAPRVSICNLLRVISLLVE